MASYREVSLVINPYRSPPLFLPLLRFFWCVFLTVRRTLPLAFPPPGNKEGGGSSRIWIDSKIRTDERLLHLPKKQMLTATERSNLRVDERYFWEKFNTLLSTVLSKIITPPPKANKRPFLLTYGKTKCLPVTLITLNPPPPVAEYSETQC